jgi:2-polyprenyl-3-methyl-5-hydroxy-6-metoxy-1,4-benzoquinol methylase
MTVPLQQEIFEFRPDDVAYWDQLYKDTQYVYGTRPNSYLRQQAFRLHPGMKALVVGDGEGRNGVWLAEQQLDVISVDYSPNGIAKGKLLAAQRKVRLRFECRDLLDWDWPNEEFHLVVAMYLHLFDSSRSRIHQYIANSLKPGGLLILEAFHQLQAQSPESKHNIGSFFTAAMLRQDFHQLNIVELMEGVVALNDGYMHQGSPNVVRLVASKPPSTTAYANRS